jgi:DNA-binding MarR family transcriptional regulator
VTRVTKHELAEEVWQSLLGYFFAHRETTLGVAQELGLTPGHVKALFALDAEIPRSMGELAEALVCDPSNATWLVDRLDERDLIERRPHPSDRRVKTVVLTAEGLAAKNQHIARMSHPPTDLAALDRDAHERLADALRLLPEHVPFYETTTSAPCATTGETAEEPVAG